MLTTESAEERQAREFAVAAERAALALERALECAGLPPLGSLGPRAASATPVGGHVHLGGCSARTAELLAAYITQHARCTGRVVRGEVVPAAVAELPAVRGELTL